jgi:phosphoenolpyruvate-protein phosphotransferase (PTS system enzyme I)
VTPMDAPATSPLSPPAGEVRFDGSGVAPGIAIGPAYIYAAPAFSAEPARIAPEAAGEEVVRFGRAVRRAERELRKIATFAREKLGASSADIFEAQILVLLDAAMHEEVEGLVRREHHRAEYAVQTVLGGIRRRMEASPNEYLRDRAGDISDVQNRLLRNLQQARAVSRVEADRIVVAETLTAADVLLFSRRHILGIATDFGGPTSHVSIMARALGVPAVVSLHGLAGALQGGETLILDGFSGRVTVNPEEETLAQYRDRQEQYRAGRAARRGTARLPAVTRDGTAITVRANVEIDEELELMALYGAEGVGLYRTEMLLLARGRPLEEDEQVEAYRRVAAAAAPHPTVLRLLDLGGDKMLPMAHREHNPFLGWRGVRILLDKPEILLPQLRAVLRVAAEAPVKVLIPMVSSIGEVRRVREYMRAAAEGLAAEGVPHRADVPLGVMVEVPAVALAADRFAPEVDFLSLGTNDLTQFVLAVDRGNDLVSDLYREVHPAVLRLIEQTIQAGARHHVPVSLCGEMAGNPRMTPLLLGLGLREFSVSPTLLPDLKEAIRATALPEARTLARRALDLPDAQSVRTLADEWMRGHLPELAPYFDHDAQPADADPPAPIA